MSIIQFFLSIGTITTAVTALAAYLGKQMIEHFSAREIERSKVEFQTQLEKYKGQLHINSIQYSKLYDERAEVVKQLYSHFNDFYQKMIDLTLRIRNITGKSEEQIKQDEMSRFVETGESGNEFLAFYNAHKIYFSKEICAKIDEMVELLKKGHSDVTFPYNFGVPSSSMTVDMFKKASEEVRGKGKELKEQIEDEFRSIIGSK